MNNTRWAEPVTHGATKFEVMTDELHARPVAVINTLDDARLIAAAPELLAACKQAASLMAELQDQTPQIIAARTMLVESIKKSDPAYYGGDQQ